MSKKQITLSTSAASFDAHFLNAVPGMVSETLTMADMLDFIPEMETAAVASPQKVTKDGDLVTLTCPEGTKETEQYLITPVFGGRPRWFEKRLLSSWVKSPEGTFHVTLPKKAVKDRGLKDLAIPA